MAKIIGSIDKDSFTPAGIHAEPDDELRAVPFQPHNFDPQVEFEVPTIYVGYKAYNDMLMLVDLCDIEIGWMGLVDKMPNGIDLRISRIMLPKQVCSSVTTKLDATALAELGESLLKLPNGTAVINKLRFWGHSHVNMETFASGQDDAQMDDFKENGCDFMIRGIMNKRGSMKFDIYYYEREMVIKDVPWNIYFPVERKKRAYWQTQIDAKVSSGYIGRSGREFVSGDGRPPWQRQNDDFETNFRMDSHKQKILGSSTAAEKEEEEENGTTEEIEVEARAKGARLDH